ncbi:unnamed protein product, partial [Brugia timori]|uniref:SRP40_C domain-containing protein n=1 Tax=Brugia timori TaxID=42155 RepID=A0A0R3QRS5_9BILA
MKSYKMTESPAIDFDVLFYDHLIKEEPKLVNKVFSAQRRDELEKRRRSSGNFKPLKEVVKEYNKIVCRKRSANGIISNSPIVKKALRQNEIDDSSGSSDSEDPIKQAATNIIKSGGTKRPPVPSSSSSSDSDIPGQMISKTVKLPQTKLSGFSNLLITTKKDAKIAKLSPSLNLLTAKKQIKKDSSSSSSGSDEVTKEEIKISSTAKQVVSKKDSSTSSSSDDSNSATKRKLLQSRPGKPVSVLFNSNLKNSVVPGSSSDTSTDDNDGMGSNVKGKITGGAVSVAPSASLGNAVVAKRLPK